MAERDVRRTPERTTKTSALFYVKKTSQTFIMHVYYICSNAALKMQFLANQVATDQLCSSDFTTSHNPKDSTKQLNVRTQNE